jgi:hypothetical protein
MPLTIKPNFLHTSFSGFIVNYISGLSGVAGASGATYNPPFYDIRDYASLNTAVSTIGNRSGTLVVSTSGNISSSVTVPYSIDLLFTNSGLFNINSGITLGIQGNIIAPNRQIFANIHTGLNKGIISFFGNRSVEKYMLPWFGPCNDKTLDAQPVIQEALNILETNQTLYAPLNQKYRLDNKLFLSGKFGLGLITEEPRYGISHPNFQSSTFYWYGKSGGVMLDMNVCEYSEIKGWIWDCSPSGAFTGINIDGQNAPTISTANKIINNRIIGPGVTGLYKFMGISIAANSSSNNEFMEIIHTNITNSPGGSGYGYGLYFGPNTNAHGHLIENSDFYYLDHGIHAESAGFVMEGINNFGASQINIIVGTRAYPTIIRGADTEDSQIFCYVSGGGDPLIIESCRIGEADTCVMRYSPVGGAVEFCNNRISFAPIIHDATNCSTLNLISSNNTLGGISHESTGEFYHFGSDCLYTSTDQGFINAHVKLLSGSRFYPSLQFTSGMELNYISHNFPAQVEKLLLLH